MELFLDTSKVEEIKKWKPFISGVTTNPTILVREGGSVEEVIEASKPHVVSLQVVGKNKKEDALQYSSMSDNVVIKVPLLDGEGGDNIGLIMDLVSRGIAVNCTALFSLPQIILAEKLGVRYISYFIGRVEDEGNNTNLEACQEYLDDSDSSTSLIVGSVRSVGHVLQCTDANVDIVTVPPAVMEKMLQHKFSQDTVKMFEEDGSR